MAVASGEGQIVRGQSGVLTTVATVDPITGDGTLGDPIGLALTVVAPLSGAGTLIDPLEVSIGGAPPAVAAASDAGTIDEASRTDHTHKSPTIYRDAGETTIIGNRPTPSATGAAVVGCNNLGSDTTAAAPGLLSDRSSILGGDANTIQTLSALSTIVGGEGNLLGDGGTASDHSVLGGGQGNKILGTHNVVAGGQNNDASAGGNHKVIGGGHDNIVSDQCSAVLSGRYHVALGETTVICGGERNTVSGDFSSVLSGANNTAIGELNASADVICGGLGNQIHGTNPTDTGPRTVAIVGGDTNLIQQDLHKDCTAGFIGGGAGNIVRNAPHGTIAGGDHNTAGTATPAGTGVTSPSIGGGTSNQATDNGTTVAGGQENLARAPFASVGGGFENDCRGSFGHIGGGNGNSEVNAFGHIGGGLQNQVTGDYGTVGGGDGNVASGTFSTVPGGNFNTASGVGSTAMGYRCTAPRPGQFQRGSAIFSTSGDNGRGAMLVIGETSGGVPLELVTVSNGASAFTIEEPRSYRVRIEVIACTNHVAEPSTKSASTQIIALVRKGTGGAVQVLNGPFTAVPFSEDPQVTGWALTVAPGATPARLAITFVPGADVAAIRAVASVEWVEVLKLDS